MNKRAMTLGTIVVIAALTRLIPHPPNVTPIAAMALFGGAYFRNWKVAFLLPIAAMLLSDLVLGYAVYGMASMKSQPVVYLCVLLTVAIGQQIQTRRSAVKIALATLASAVIFYLVTNFAVWAFDALYPKTWSGLITCYTAAIPFFRNSLIGDLSFAAVMFGGFGALERFFISLREQQAPLHA
jgi:ABC-type transport system involved in multi-copper enzyme maturation permease subunit